MDKILIPTDFTEESLQLIEFALLNFTGDHLDILLVHGYNPPAVNMRFYSPNKVLSKLCTADFSRAIRNISQDHRDRIRRIQFQIYSGNNALVFKDFLKENNITASVLPNVPFSFPKGSRSFDLTRLITKHVPDTVKVPLSMPEIQVAEPKFSLLGLWYF